VKGAQSSPAVRSHQPRFDEQYGALQSNRGGRRYPQRLLAYARLIPETRLSARPADVQNRSRRFCG
jgi:hypothetical protein